MGTLTEKISQGYILEDESRNDKQISANGINGKPVENNIQGKPVIDITREQWFWDMAVMS